MKIKIIAILTFLFMFAPIRLSFAQVCNPPCIFGALGADSVCRNTCGPSYLCKPCPVGAGGTCPSRCVSAVGEPIFENNEIAPGSYSLTGSGMKSLLDNVINAVGAVAGLYFLIQFILSAIKYISQGGDDKALASARKAMSNATLGLIMVFMAWWVVRIVGTIFGINLLKPIFKGP